MKISVVAFAVAASVLTASAGLAVAQRVIIEPPVFVPEAEFHHEGGYYRTHEGHYYHYDRDREGWHYGRNHDEGRRWERRHEHERR